MFGITLEEFGVVALFVLFWFHASYCYPKTMLICLGLSFFAGGNWPLAFAVLSVIGYFVMSPFGRGFLAGFGISLAWTVHQGNKGLKRSIAKDELRRSMNRNR